MANDGAGWDRVAWSHLGRAAAGGGAGAVLAAGGGLGVQA
jgi:hypothetical protein